LGAPRNMRFIFTIAMMLVVGAGAILGLNSTNEHRDAATNGGFSVSIVSYSDRGSTQCDPGNIRIDESNIRIDECGIQLDASQADPGNIRMDE
jgi:hypothetical protein